MTHTVLCSGPVFDGTGSTVANADVVLEEGLIVELGVSDLRPLVAMVFQDGRLVAGDGDDEDRPLVLGSHE